MKIIKTILISLTLFIGLGFLLLLVDQSPVLIESLESKTIEGTAVYNRIHFQFGLNQDTWVMQQSHQGLNKNFDEWDKLAIVVDKSQTISQANFHQKSPGPIKLSSENQEIDFKVRCYACHANGPRAIRPNYNSTNAPLNLKNKIKIFYLNLIIKSYGHLSAQAGNPLNKDNFKSTHPILQKSLQLNSCIQCHSSTGIRSELKMEQYDTLKFLIEQKQMPPFPFKISEEDLRFLKILK